MAYESTSPQRELNDMSRPWKGGFSLVGVLKMQSFADFLLAIGFGIPLAIAYGVANPYKRAIFIYDATISYPDLGGSTIPNWLTVFVPILSLILTVVVVEVLLARPMGLHTTWTAAVGAALFFFTQAAWGYIFNLFVSQVTNFIVGYPRPEFLERCQPQATSNGIQLAIGEGSTLDCTGDQEKIKDGLKSFPSGHASTSAVISLYITVYLLWAIYVRSRRRLVTPSSKWSAIANDFLHTLGFLWILGMWCWAWFIGASRIIDNEHSPADVAAGLINGIVIGTIFAVRAIFRSDYFLTSNEKTTANIPAVQHDIP